MLLTPGTDNEAIQELRDELKDLNKSLKRSNIVNGRLTVLLFLIAYCQLFVAIFQLCIMIAGPNNNAAWLAIAVTILLGGVMWYFLGDYLKSEKKSDK